MTQPLGIEIEVPKPDAVVLTVPGPQGPPGLQNVVVSATPPEEPFLNLVWIDIS